MSQNEYKVDSPFGGAVPGSVSMGVGDTGLAIPNKMDASGNSSENITIVTSIVDIANSSTTPLGIGGVFTGAWIPVLLYSQIDVLAYSDQASTVGGFQIQFSTDGINVDHIHPYSVIALDGEEVQIHIHAKYYRIVYTNGAVAQTIFRLQSILNPISGTGSIIEAEQTITGVDDCLLTKSVLTGKNAADPTKYVDAKVTPDGGVTINQNTTVDTLSSTTANLASGATFTGPSTSDLYFTAVQFIFKADQNCTIFVEQSPDGTNWDVSDPFNFYTSIGNSSNTIQLTGSFYRIRVQNVGSATTTFLRLQVIQIPFLPSLPRALNDDGNLRTTIDDGITDESGFTTYFTPFGEQVSVPVYRVIGGVFVGSALDANFFTASLGTGGTAVVANGQLTLATGTTADNATSIESNKHARFVAGQAIKYTASIQLPDSGATANNTRRWGAFNTTDGAFFQVANGVFSLKTRINSVDSTIANGSFNGKLGTTYTLSANIVRYHIIYNVSSIYFFVNDVLLHTVNFPTTTWTASYHLPIRYENFNTGGSILNVSLVTRGSYTARLGIPQTQPTSFFQVGLTAGVTLKNGPGNIHGIVLSGITNNSVATFYDNTAASGTVIWTTGPLTSNGLPFFIDMKGIAFSNGLTLTVTAAALNVLTMYE